MPGSTLPARKAPNNGLEVFRTHIPGNCFLNMEAARALVKLARHQARIEAVGYEKIF